MNDLIQLYYDGTNYTDISQDMNDFLRDTQVFNWTGATDEIYIGLYKPFDTVFLELKNAAAMGGSLSFEYFDGTSFVALTVSDDTKDLYRSGFINWSKPSKWSETAIAGASAFWIRVSYSVDDTFELSGINTVYADDNDLTATSRNIDRFLAKGDTSFIAYHQAARNEIVQSIRNSGNAKMRKSENFFRDFGKWDFLDQSQIREAAKFLCLSLIFSDASDNIDDKSYQKSMDFRARFGESFKLFFRSLDQNDDGIAEPFEKMAVRSIRSFKV